MSCCPCHTTMPCAVRLVHSHPLPPSPLCCQLAGSPYFDSVGSVLLTLLIVASGGIIAFSMVWSEFKLIKCTSALTFMVAGTFKEIITGVWGVWARSALRCAAVCWWAGYLWHKASRRNEHVPKLSERILCEIAAAIAPLLLQ